VFPYRRLARKIARYAPDRIHIAVEGPLGWAARRYCLRHRRPYSTAFHTNFPAYIALRAPGVIRASLQKLTLWALRRFHDRAEYTYVATPSVTAQLRAWGFAGVNRLFLCAMMCRSCFMSGGWQPKRTLTPFWA
jgi:hypothetical protein